MSWSAQTNALSVYFSDIYRFEELATSRKIKKVSEKNIDMMSKTGLVL